MEDYKKTLIAGISKTITDFDIDRMVNRQDGDAECENLFSVKVIDELKANEFNELFQQKANTLLIDKNLKLINSMSEDNLNFYLMLNSKLNERTTFVVLFQEYLDHGEINSFVFNHEGNLVILAA
jgi:hypothetical protein